MDSSSDKLTRLREMTCIWLRKGNLKRETESLLIVAQNNAEQITYIKTKIDIHKAIVSVGCVEIEIKRLNASKANAVNWPRRNTGLGSKSDSQGMVQEIKI